MAGIIAGNWHVFAISPVAAIKYPNKRDLRQKRGGGLVLTQGSRVQSIRQRSHGSLNWSHCIRSKDAEKGDC